jgi:hypothetical protein
MENNIGSIHVTTKFRTRMMRMQVARTYTDQISENQRSEISGIRVPIRNGTLVLPTRLSTSSQVQATRIDTDQISETCVERCGCSRVQKK